jgi:hypothetical protein
VFAGQIVLLSVLAALLVDLSQWGIEGDFSRAPLAWLILGGVAARRTDGSMRVRLPA